MRTESSRLGFVYGLVQFDLKGGVQCLQLLYALLKFLNCRAHLLFGKSLLNVQGAVEVPGLHVKQQDALGTCLIAGIGNSLQQFRLKGFAKSFFRPWMSSDFPT